MCNNILESLNNYLYKTVFKSINIMHKTVFKKY